MGKGLWARPWVRHIAVAVSYGLAVVVFRELSVVQWMILAGLRLSVLLLAPYRYWPALAVGESGFFIYQAIDCVGKWGMAWSLCSGVPTMVFAIPIMYWVREHWNPTGKHAINVGGLLTCALLMSFIATLRDLGVFSLIKSLPVGYVVNYPRFGADYFVGNYLGILTITPVVLFVHQTIAEAGWHQLSRKISSSRLWFDSICLGVPLLTFLLWIGITSSPHAQTRQIVQIAMFLPVIWLALRHGWQGAAVGGAVASCAVMALMPKDHDPDTLRAEAVVALAISTMLLMGARIAALDRTASQDRSDFHAALALAQRNVYVGEMQLRMTSQALEQIRETIQVGFALMMGRLRHLQPAVDDRGYRRQALSAQDQLYRLADGLYPVALRERGLPTALRDGALARMLDEAGLTYSCELSGPVSKLSNMLRMTIYRIIWEGVTEACLKKDVSEIRVRVRCGERRRRRGAVVTIYSQVNLAAAERIRWEEMLPGMVRVSSGLGLQAIRDRAAIFEGYAKTRSLHRRRCISVCMLDPRDPGGI